MCFVGDERERRGGAPIRLADEAVREGRRRSVISFINAHTRAVLLGDPGAGKTTFANYLSLCLAGERLGMPEANLSKLGEDWKQGPLIPLRVVLRDLVTKRGIEIPDPIGQFWQYVSQRMGQGLQAFLPALQAHWTQHGGILILDGLDEVPEAKGLRETVRNMAKEFCRQMPKMRVLLTSRTYAYQPPDQRTGRPDTRISGFEEAELAPFNNEQINTFIEAWYSETARYRRGRIAENASGRAAQLNEAIMRSPYLKELATRPLLLTLMASLHAWRGGNLPEKREELYEDSVELLLDLWQRPKSYVNSEGKQQTQDASAFTWLGVSFDQIRKALEEVAYKAHASQVQLVGTADIPEHDVVEALMGVARKTNPGLAP